MNCGQNLGADPRRLALAFTLFEVMIALTIFFVAIFSILELTSRSLRAAQSLRLIPPDIGSLAAELSLTNSLEEGVESGDFGDRYPGYSWSREVRLAATNGLYLVDFNMHWSENRQPRSTHMAVFYYRPGGGGAPGARAPGGRR